MSSRIITLGCLYGWRNLNDIHVARFNLGLHKEIDYSVNLLTYNPKISYLRLHDYGLLCYKPVVLIALYSGYRKEGAFSVMYLPHIIIIEPEAVVPRLTLLD